LAAKMWCFIPEDRTLHVNSIGFWRWRVIIRINVFLDCVHRPRLHKTWISLRFGDWLCPRPQVYKIRWGERLKDNKVNMV
jgi:hypothetical protein